MNAIHEALARERMLAGHQRAREARLAAHVSAARRWHRLSAQAGAAEARHTRRLAELPL